MTKQRKFEYAPTFDNKDNLINLPRRQTRRSAGYDLQSAVDVFIPAGKHALIATGLTAQMRDNDELQIRPRSGLALKHGVTVLNSPGTIDADYYPNEIKVLLINTSDRDFLVNAGDRIAQAVFARYHLTDDDNPIETDREGGFGHTGGN